MTNSDSSLIPTTSHRFRSRLRRTAGLAATAGAGLTVIWALTGGGAFWPVWAWIGLAAAVAADVGFQFAKRRSDGPRRPIAVVGAVAGVLIPIEIALWACTGGGYFWPVWSALVLGGAALVARIVSVPSPPPADTPRPAVPRIDAAPTGSLAGQRALGGG